MFHWETKNPYFCRTCLSETGEELLVLDKELISILKECTSVEVLENEDAKLICTQCKSMLINFFEFRSKCLQVNNIIRAQLNITATTKQTQSPTKCELFPDLKDESNDSYPLDKRLAYDNDDVDKDNNNYNSDSDSCHEKVAIKRRRVPKKPIKKEKIAENDELLEKKFKLFVCSHCTKVYVDKERYKWHVTTEHAARQDPSQKTRKSCIFCDKTLVGMRALAKHIRIEHKRIAPTITCPVCEETFHMDEQLTSHMANFHRVETCRVCNKTLKNGKYGLQTHLKRHARQYLDNVKSERECVNDTPIKHELNNSNGVDEKFLLDVECSLIDKTDQIFSGENQARTLKCPKCPKLFATQRQVQRHTFTHVTEKPYQCSDCSKGFCQLNLLTSHVKQMHGQLPHFKCPQCDETFYVEVALNKHVERIHFDRQCKYCNQPMSNYKKLRKHITRVHASTVSLYCQECDRTFKQERSYKLHMDRHNGVDFRKICNMCGLKFLHLSMHMYNVHKIGQRTFKCRRCDETFEDKATVRRHAKEFHIKQHTNEDYNYQCELCPRRFLVKINLDNHYKRVHSPCRVARHKCTLCDLEFKTKQRYDYHMRGHTGERPYGCEFCEMKFRARKTLMVHRRIHTGEKPHKCHVCDKRFMHYNTYAAHVKSHPQSSDVFIDQLKY